MRPPSPRRAELSALVRLAVPLAAAQGGQALMGVVDTAVVGRAGAVALAGVGLGNALFFALAIFGMGIMMGLDPLIAQAFGAGDRASAWRLARHGRWLALLVAAALAVPLALLPLALEPLGVSPEIADQAARFIWWRLPGLPFLLLYVSGRAYLQAAGRTHPLVVATVLANLVNLALDLLLVFGGAGLPGWTGPLRAIPALGVAGAAIATDLCLVLQAALLAAASHQEASTEPAGGVGARPARGELWHATRLGLPTGLHLAAELAFFSLAGFLAARLGTLPMAAHQIALAVAGLTFTVAVGVGSAGSVRVALLVGRRDRAGARRAGTTALGAVTGFMALCGLVFLVAPELVIRLMTDDPEVAAAAVPLFRVAAVFQIADGLQAVGAAVLRGAGETRFTFLANLAAYWVLALPAALGLAFWARLGVVGLWWGFVVGLTGVAAALVGRFLRISGREIAPLSTPPAG